MTTLIKRQPNGLEFGDWMSRLFDDRYLPGFLLRDTALTGKDALRVEEYVDSDTLVVRAEMPGIDPDKDIDISMHDGLLHIRAERRDTSEHADTSGYRSEFTYGMFERALPLPAGVSEKDVTATYKDGILEVRIPTKGEEKGMAKVPVTRLP